MKGHGEAGDAALWISELAFSGWHEVVIQTCTLLNRLAGQ